MEKEDAAHKSSNKDAKSDRGHNASTESSSKKKSQLRPAPPAAPPPKLFNGGTANDAVQAVKTRKGWLDFMYPAAKQLNKRCEADYSVTKTWNYACCICEQDLPGSLPKHLIGEYHRRRVAARIENRMREGQLTEQGPLTTAQEAEFSGAEWEQGFQLSDRKLLFNHLTGCLTIGTNSTAIFRLSGDSRQTGEPQDATAREVMKKFMDTRTRE